MVIKTNALIYDDRLRKEIQSLTRLQKSVSVSVVEDNNTSSVPNSGVALAEYFVYSLLSKKLLNHRFFVVCHLVEFVFLTLRDILRKKPDTVWIHDPILFVFIPFLMIMRRTKVIRKIVWDHHELPIERINKSNFLRRVFSWFCRQTDSLIVANPQRLDHLHKHYFGMTKLSSFVLRNYSDESFARQPVKALPKDLIEWLNGRCYFLVQSGLVEHRNFRSVADAIIPQESFPPVVAVGGGNEALIREFKEKYGEMFSKRVFIVNKVPQLEMTRYLDSALASIIFYRRDLGINNWICEPNRLFQALSRKVPVIAGNNPPMKDILTDSKLSKVALDDGSNVDFVRNAIQQFLDEYQGITNQQDVCEHNYCWESQNNVISEVIA